MAQRPAPLVSRRPQPNNGPVGGTSLGTPLKTKVVMAPASSPTPAAAAAAGPATPLRARPAPSASPVAARTPAKAAPVRGFGSSVPSSVVPASSPAAASASAAAAASPAAGKALSRQRYDSAKTTDPFASGSRLKFKTSFSDAYVNGRVPCRINHGTVRHTLQWDRPSSELDLPYLLPVVADGLRETEHPYVLIARQAFPQLLTEGGQARVAPLIPALVQPLRRALMDPAAGVYAAACHAIQQLSDCVGPLLNGHLDLLLVQVAKKMMAGKASSAAAKAEADLSSDTVAALAQNGGDDAVPIIKKRVPGFVM